MVSLITDADCSACTVAVAAAEPRAGLPDVNMVHAPALTLSCPLLLNPAELGSPKNTQQVRNTNHNKDCCMVIQLFCSIAKNGNTIFVCSHPEETWSGSWTVTLVHVELLTGL